MGGASPTSFDPDRCAISARNILRNCTHQIAPMATADTPVTPASISPSIRTSAAMTIKNAATGLSRMRAETDDTAAQI